MSKQTAEDFFDTLAQTVWDRIDPRDFTVRDLAEALRDAMASKSPCANREHDWLDGRCQRCGEELKLQR